MPIKIKKRIIQKSFNVTNQLPASFDTANESINSSSQNQAFILLIRGNTKLRLLVEHAKPGHSE
jgi:hypothetical protein